MRVMSQHKQCVPNSGETDYDFDYYTNESGRKVRKPHRYLLEYCR
jgi:hypothetical protein